MEQKLSWKKSSYSGTSNGANCVETAPAPEGIAVRDSQDQDGCQLRFAPTAWKTFSSKVKEGAR
jgi:hypothetical protein